MTFTLNLTAVLFAACATANQILSGDGLLLRSEDVLYRPYSAVLTGATRDLSRRQTDSLGDVPVTDSTNTTDDSVQLNADGSLNVTAWNNVTDSACIKSLSALPRSSNPSGHCVCYNLPSLDTDTGVFEADLRLYKISEPRGFWAGISPEDIEVGLRYVGASVTQADASTNTTNSTVETKRKRETNPELMQQYLLVGQIDQDRMSENLTMATIEALIMPILTLSAKNSTGGQVSTNVSVNEASFLTGVFSREVVMSDWSMAQVAVDDQVAGLKNGTVAFVLPGVQLLVFPVGLIITSVWLLIGLAAYGFGTWERMKYADMYKRRQAIPTNRGKPI